MPQYVIHSNRLGPDVASRERLLNCHKPDPAPRPNTPRLSGQSRRFVQSSEGRALRWSMPVRTHSATPAETPLVRVPANTHNSNREWWATLKSNSSHKLLRLFTPVLLGFCGCFVWSCGQNVSMSGAIVSKNVFQGKVQSRLMDVKFDSRCISPLRSILVFRCTSDPS